MAPLLESPLVSLKVTLDEWLFYFVWRMRQWNIREGRWSANAFNADIVKLAGLAGMVIPVRNAKATPIPTDGGMTSIGETQ